MLPIMLFTIRYESIWLIVVAYPLWRANALWGSPAEPMTRAFLWLPLAIIAVPWGIRASELCDVVHDTELRTKESSCRAATGR